MANALDAVLELRRQEQAQQEAQSQALTQAATIFMQARQLKQQEQLRKLELAQEQQKMLQEQNDPLNQLIKKAKAVEAAKSLGDRSLFDKLRGQSSQQPANPITQPIQSAEQTVGQPVIQDDALLYQAANEIDPMTEKPTARAEQAKATLELKKQKQAEIIKGPAEGAIGKISLAQESIKNINDIEKILFPDGTDESFDRGIAARGNMPGLVLPFFGKVTPRVAADNPLDNNQTENKRAELGQTFGRKIGSSLAARSLIQTGVASRPEEIQALYQQYAPNFFSSPKSAREGLKELRKFYEDYLTNALPEKRLEKNSKADSKKLDINKAKEFLNKSNGDKNKARELARQEGYEF